MGKKKVESFTEGEFDKLCKEDKAFERIYDDWLVFESWLAMQGQGLQKEIDNKCKEYVQQLNNEDETTKSKHG